MKTPAWWWLPAGKVPTCTRNKYFSSITGTQQGTVGNVWCRDTCFVLEIIWKNNRIRLWNGSAWNMWWPGRWLKIFLKILWKHCWNVFWSRLKCKSPAETAESSSGTYMHQRHPAVHPSDYCLWKKEQGLRSQWVPFQAQLEGSKLNEEMCRAPQKVPQGKGGGNDREYTQSSFCISLIFNTAQKKCKGQALGTSSLRNPWGHALRHYGLS